MIENYKANLLDYLTGNLEITDKSTNPYYLDTKNEISEELYDYIKETFSGSFEVDGSVQCKDGKGVPNGKILFWGTGYEEDTLDPIPFLLLVDYDLNPLKLITTYETGSPLFSIGTLDVAEDGTIYGIDYTTEFADDPDVPVYKFRIVLFNNISEIPKGYDTYQAILRNSYYIQGLTSSDTPNMIRPPYIKKSPQSATYYFTLSVEEIGDIYYCGTFKINVGSSNEWTRYPDQVWADYSRRITVAYFDRDDVVHAIFYELLDGYGDSSAIIKVEAVGNSQGTTSEIIHNIDSYFAEGDSYYYYNPQLIPFGNKFYLLMGGKSGSTVNTIKQKFMIGYYDNDFNILFKKVGDIQGEDSQVWEPEVSASLVNDNLSYFLFWQRSITGDDLDDVYYGFANNDKDIMPLVKTDVIRNTSVYASFDLVLSCNNSFNLYKSTLYLYTEDGYQKVYASLIYNESNYNGEAYTNDTSLIGNQGILLDTNNEPIFARNLYNYKVYNNRVNSVLNVPNNMLNGISIDKEQLLGKTNSTIFESENTITKNIYEDLYINNFITLNMVNENEDIYITNKSGAINLTQSAFKNGDYENGKATKMRITYDDNSTLITSTSATINNGIGTYDISVYIPNDKNIDHIDIMSEDENIVYQTIANETISKLNLQNNKYYHITQDVHIE